MIGEQQQEGRITVFHLKDDLTPNRVKAFMKKMESLTDEGRHHIVLDMASVQDVCLLGMVAISAIFNRCRQAGGALKISSLTPLVRRSFRKTNLINTVEVYDEVLEAVKSFRSQNLLQSKTYTGSFFIKEKGAFVGWDRYPSNGVFN